MDERRAVAPRLTVSIVSYGGDRHYLRATLTSRAAAARVRDPRPGAARVVLIDNGRAEGATLVSEHGNVGYRRGHNLALGDAEAPDHLILNPDLEVAAGVLAAGVGCLERNPACGLVPPSVRDGSGRLQYLCKPIPSGLDLAPRGLAPAPLRRLVARRLARYEMRDQVNEREQLWDPPLVSGCVMLFRASVLRAVGGFDPRYFLYFEDFDLSLRIARIAYVPWVRVVHHGGGAARKGPAHLRLFAACAVRFFHTHGGRWV